MIAIGRWMLCALFITGCATQPVSKPPVRLAEFVESQQAAALQLEAQGAWHEALVRWRTLKLAGEEGADVEILRLQALIDEEVARRTGLAARAGGNPRVSQEHYLAVLALQPGHAEALKALRNIKSVQVSAQQTRKVEEENLARMARLARSNQVPAVVLERFSAYVAGGEFARFVAEQADLDNPQRDARFRNLHFDALAGLAANLEEAGELAEAAAQLLAAQTLVEDRAAEVEADRVRLHGLLGEQWYAQGLKLMRSDPLQAIDALEKAVAYDPANQAARQQLERARRMQANLDRLRKNRG